MSWAASTPVKASKVLVLLGGGGGAGGGLLGSG